MKKNRTFGVIARVACVLLCLVLFSAHLCSGMFARYTVGGIESSSSYAAAANVKAVQAEAMSVDANGNGTYRFTLVNQSNVAMDCDLVIDFYTNDTVYSQYGSNILSNAVVNVKLNGNEADEFKDGIYPTYTFKCGHLAPKDEEGSTMDMELTFTAKLIAFNTDSVTGLSGGYLPVGVEIFPDATQID